MLSRLITLIACFSLSAVLSFAQGGGACPQNIGFESGSFANWKAYNGIVKVGTTNGERVAQYELRETPPVYNQHELIAKGDEVDEYGEFSLNSPNGSDYVLKLGNDDGEHGAERVSYNLNVPANVPSYSIIFNYAVVLQNPNHQPYEQPKFTVQIIDETENTTTSCGSFEFVASGSLPGFKFSTSTEKTNVVYKEWSPVLLNLSAYLGHRIRLEFTTNDCVHIQHFGYVYLDVTENCAYPVTGNVICPSAEPIVLKTVPGLNEYEWSNTVTGQLLGTADSLILPADTPVGTQISVKLVPFPGLGCIQTLYVKIEGPRVDIIHPPPDCISVDITTTSVLGGNYPGQKFSFWSDANATIPLPNPKKILKSGSYFIKGETKPGCFAVGVVKVVIIDPPKISIVNPEPVNYPATVDITSSFVPEAGLKYTYWKDTKATVVLANPQAVNRDATFYIKVTNITGCITIAPVKADIIYSGIVIPNAFSPNGDGVNDLLTVLIDNSVKLKAFKIINKWGDVVYTTADIYEYWDGTRDGKPLPVGVYYWFLDAVDSTQRKFRDSGAVTVLK